MMATQIKSPKKLIEVALPLDAINLAAGYEKQPGIGAHPRGLHLWWARRPLAVARAVIFAQMVNDPGYDRTLGRGVNKEKASAERERLFRMLEKLVLWENTNNENLLIEAREEILKSWQETCALNKAHPQADTLFNPEKLPAFHDPFAGGGALPLEAQKLGMESYASDLNPVAVLINKAMIDIPLRFAGLPPVGQISSDVRQSRLHEDWSGANGLAEDVRRYGSWILDKARAQMVRFYPDILVTSALVKERPDLLPYENQRLKAIAYLWTRTVKCPNPACGCTTPLLSSFILSSRKGKEAYLVPSLNAKSELCFNVVTEKQKDIKYYSDGFKRGISGIFECIKCGTVTSRDYAAAQATTIGFGLALTAIVCEGKGGKVYLPPSRDAIPNNIPDANLTGLTIELAPNPRDVWCRNFGLNTVADLFTKRQLLALTTISDLIPEAVAKCHQDAIRAGLPKDIAGLDSNNNTAMAYAEAIGTYLAFAVCRLADYGSTLSTWKPSGEQVMQTFKRQTLPMTWDFPESNFFADKAICWRNAVKYTADNLVATMKMSNLPRGYAYQEDAQNQTRSRDKVVSTDPPYYKNISYADLSDYFYAWLRRSLKPIFPSLFSTLAVPKAEELVAMPYRQGSRAKADSFFLDGMTHAIRNLAEQAHPAFPVTIYYAVMQAETKSSEGISSTGWETFLEAVIQSGFAISGTWPMRTESSSRIISAGTNALASSIVLVCRKRFANAQIVGRRDFIRELNATLPEAYAEMTRGGVNSPVAPVDLSQAIIGPGMAIFSQYAAVLEADGSHMSVRNALMLINRFFAEEDFEHETQFCLHWFDGYGWGAGKYGEADVLARAKGTSVTVIADAGAVESGGSNVRLLRYGEYPVDWSPSKENRTPIWVALHYMILAHQRDGEDGAGKLLAAMPTLTEQIRSLAYRLYTLCERKGWSEEARAYNELITSWTGIENASQELGHAGSQVRMNI